MTTKHTRTGNDPRKMDERERAWVGHVLNGKGPQKAADLAGYRRTDVSRLVQRAVLRGCLPFDLPLDRIKF